MTLRILTALTLVFAASTTGCNSMFTSIQKQPDNSYFLTQVKQGPFFVAGSGWKCVPVSELVMKCSRVGVP